MAVMYASYSLRTGEAIKESVVCESAELAVNEFVFICKSDPSSHYLRVLAPLVISPRPLQIFI